MKKSPKNSWQSCCYKTISYTTNKSTPNPWARLLPSIITSSHGFSSYAYDYIFTKPIIIISREKKRNIFRNKEKQRKCVSG